jgi:hypothetical protein
MYGRYKAGRPMLSTIDQTGFDMPLDSHPVHISVHSIMPVSGTATPVVIRMGTSNGGLTATTPAVTNLFTTQARLTVTTAATANANAFITSQTTLFSRGAVGNTGGFYAVFKFGLDATAANQHFYIGFAATTGGSNASANTQPNNIGFWKPPLVANLQALCSNNSAAGAGSSNVDTGFDFTTARTNWYEGIIYAIPNGNCYWQLTNITTGAVSNGQFNNTNLPANTLALAFKSYICSGIGQATAVGYGFGGVQIETIN